MKRFLPLLLISILITISSLDCCGAEDKIDYNKYVISEEVVGPVDPDILNLIELWECPYFIATVTDECYGSYLDLQNSGLKLQDVCAYNDMVIELYSGKENCYLAILRQDDRVYCAQCVNGIMSDEYEESMRGDICIHSTITCRTGTALQRDCAYFIDGKMLLSVTFIPYDAEPLIEWEDNQSLVALLLEQRQ